MSALDRYFSIFEGAKDAENRQWARDVFESVLHALKEPRTQRSFQRIEEGYDSGCLFTYDSVVQKKNRIAGAEKLVFAFIPLDIEKHGNETANLSRLREGFFLVSLIVKWNGNGDFAELARKHAVHLFETRKTHVIHELTHVKDLTRIKNPDSAYTQTIKATNTSEKDYYNSPLEFNAYVQQGFSDLEDHLASMSLAQAQKIVGGSANDMYREFMKVIGRNFNRNIVDKNRNKLKKRVYQFWNDVIKNKQQGDVKK